MATASTVALPRIPEPTYSSFTQQGSLALPEGLPQKLASDLCWTGAELTDEAAYVVHLTSAHLLEINDALTHFKSTSHRTSGCVLSLANF
jgi:hypothetical protein